MQMWAQKLAQLNLPQNLCMTDKIKGTFCKLTCSLNLEKEGNGRGNGGLINAVSICDDKTTITSPRLTKKNDQFQLKVTIVVNQKQPGFCHFD